MTEARNRIAIRPPTEDDAERFWSLRLRSLPGHREALGRSFEEELAIPLVEVRRRKASPSGGFGLGTWRLDDLVNVVGVRRSAPKKEWHKATLWRVYIAPEAPGAGVACSLLTEAIARARALPGLDQIQLLAGASRAARCLYASLGFEPFGPERRAIKLTDGTYVDEEPMVLFLDH